MDVADAAGEEIDPEIGDLLALGRVGELAVGGHAVLGAADAADLGLDGHALGWASSTSSSLVRSRLKLEGLLVRTVIHDGREAGLDALKQSS